MHGWTDNPNLECMVNGIECYGSCVCEQFNHLVFIFIGSFVITEPYFTSSHSKIYNFDIECNGDEKNFSNCSYHTYGDDVLNIWYNEQRAGVACEPNASAGNIHIYVPTL